MSLTAIIRRFRRRITEPKEKKKVKISQNIFIVSLFSLSLFSLALFVTQVLKSDSVLVFIRLQSFLPQVIPLFFEPVELFRHKQKKNSHQTTKKGVNIKAQRKN